MLWDRDKVSYLAGLFDGEGCIYIARHKGGREGKYVYIKLRMIISNTNREVMDWLSAEFGGSVYNRKKKNPKMGIIG